MNWKNITKFIRYKIKKASSRWPKYRTFENDQVAVEAFKLNGKSYYHFQDASNLPAGRGYAALAIYTELQMRCTQEYLKKHCEATELILSDPKKINLQAIAVMNKNLQERLNLAPFPDHILKMASVLYFDETESPYTYDYEYNRQKVAQWKKDPDVLDFFLRGPLAGLIPFSTISAYDAKMFFPVSEQIDQLHQEYLSEQLSKRK